MQAAVAVGTETAPPNPILELIIAGRHRDAAGECARTYGRVLGRLAMALTGSQADADEVVQETLLRAHRAMPSYRGEGSVKAWLCGIARHVCAHVLELRQRGDRLETALAVVDRGDGVKIEARELRAALQTLKPSEREALVLRYVADLSHREIATACGIDEAAARKRISRALAKMRRSFS